MTLNQSDISYSLYVTQRANGKNLTYFHEFPTNLGAGEHCSIGAETQVWSSMMGWLSSIWGGYKFANNAS